MEACERTDATEPEGDFGRDIGELSGAGRRRFAAFAGDSVGDLSSTSSPTVDVEDVRDSDRGIVSLEGVSLESGLGPKFVNGRRGWVADMSLILGVVECVLRAERIELLEEIRGSLGDVGA